MPYDRGGRHLWVRKWARVAFFCTGEQYRHNGGMAFAEWSATTHAPGITRRAARADEAWTGHECI